MERKITRRQLLFEAASKAALIIPLPEFIYNEREPKTFSVFGLHGAPNDGGDIDPDLAIADLKELGAKWYVTIEPSTELLQKLTSSGINTIIRTTQSGNVFNENRLSKLLEKYQPYIKHPIIQPFNEVNLLEETADIPQTAKDHIRNNFIKAARLIASSGGITLLTPLAQRATGPNFEELGYFKEMLEELGQVAHVSWLKRFVAVAVHNYIFSEGENHWPRIVKLEKQTREILGVTLPIYVTEFGIHQSRLTQLPESMVAEETLRLLETRIPVQIPVRSICFWVLANFAQRPPDHQNLDFLHDFEVASWRALTGPKEVFKAVKAYSSLQNSPKSPRK